MARILLTGANGFVGKVLQRRLLNSNHEVVGTVASTSAPAECDYQVMDICDRAQVEAVIQRVKPTHLVHLAAVSNVAVSFKEPLLTWHTNVIGTLNLMEGLKAHAPECFTLFVSSSEVYGESFKSGQLLDENATCVPMNPYAASKLAAEHAVMQYLRQGMPGVVVRPFNHIGPGQSADFVTASFARQIAWIEAGLQPPVLKVGNLDASRDFLNVHDVCEATQCCLTQTGTSFSTGRTTLLLAQAGRSAACCRRCWPKLRYRSPSRPTPTACALRTFRWQQGPMPESKKPWAGYLLRRWRRRCVTFSTTGVARRYWNPL